MVDDILFQNAISAIQKSIDDAKNQGRREPIPRPRIMWKDTNSNVNSMIVEHFTSLGYAVYLEPHFDEVVFGISW